MKKAKIFTPLVLFLLAVCVSTNLNAQAVPVPVLGSDHPWHYETNAGETQAVDMVDPSTVPDGINEPADYVFKHTSFIDHPHGGGVEQFLFSRTLL